MPGPRTFLVDDHRMILESFQHALSGHLEVVGTAARAAEVAPALRHLRPELVLLDLGLPDRSGLELIGELTAEFPAIRILVVSMHTDRILATAALRAGALGYVPKDAGMVELLRAVQEVMVGRPFISDHVPPRPTWRSGPGSPLMAFNRLTPRQRQIVQLLADGRTTQQIAARLGISPHTVTFHRHQIRKALGLKHPAELRRYATLVFLARERKGKG